MPRRGNFEIHDFYCMNCGKKSMILPRSQNRQRGKMHEKKLFCIFCNETLNHVECRTAADVEKFKKKLERGDYKEKAKESIEFVKGGN